jgi:hypothetical protein
MLVAVESFDQLETPRPQPKQLVLIPAPVVLDASIMEPPISREPDKLTPLLACPSCNNELQVDGSRLEKPFRCPLCFRLLVARVISEVSGGKDLKRIILEKVTGELPSQEQSNENWTANRVERPSSSPTFRRSGESEIWPTTPIASGSRTALVAQLVLYIVLYSSLIALLFGVFRKDMVISAITFALALAAFCTLLLRRFRGLRRERNLKAQFQSLTGQSSNSGYWMVKGFIIGFFALVLLAAGYEIFMVIQALDSPHDWRLTLALILLACLVSVFSLASLFFGPRKSHVSKANSNLSQSRALGVSKKTPVLQEAR